MARRAVERRAAVAATGLALALAGCSGAGTVPAEWVLSAPTEGSTVELEVAIGVPCNELGDVGVLESTTSVRIQASVVTSDEECDASFETRPHTVELSAPVGERALTGCAPGADETIRFGGEALDDEDCV